MCLSSRAETGVKNGLTENEKELNGGTHHEKEI